MAYIQDWGMRVQAQPQINTTRRSFLHLSQNENGRMLNIRITDVNIPSGSTAVLAGTKPDGTVYSQAGTLAGNTATFAEDVQMTAVAGTWDAKITVTNGGNCICTARITITIDPDTVAGGAVPSDSQLDGIIAECRAIADSVRKEAYGSPLVADAVEDMTDQSRVYVYTGSESGMTAGHWYYWNGSAWADGGVYNSVAVQTDKTLAVADKAADAKITGDKISELKNTLSENSIIFASSDFADNVTRSDVLYKRVDFFTYHLSGTASADSFDNLFNSTNGVFSNGIKLSSSLIVQIGSTGTMPRDKVYIELLKKDANHSSWYGTTNIKNDTIIDTSAWTDVLFRIRVKNGAVVDGNLTVKISNAIGNYKTTLEKDIMAYKGELQADSDLNSVDKTGLWFLGTNQNYSHLPFPVSSWGFLYSVVSYSTRMQYAIQSYQSNNATLWKRSYINNTWDEWRKAIVDDYLVKTKESTAGELGILDLNDMVGNNIYMLTDSYTFSNKPSGMTIGFVAVIKTGGFHLQLAWNYNGGAMWKRRGNAAGTAWEAWQTIAGTSVVNNYTNEYSFPEYSQTVDLTSSPQITADTNNYLAPSGDSTDRTADILAMLASNGVCRLGAGNYYINGLQMPDDSSIIGSGSATQIILSGSSDGFAIKPGSYCTLSDFSLKGSLSVPTFGDTIGGRHGILWQGTYTDNQRAPYLLRINNIYIANFTGGGITCYDTGYGTANGIEATNLFVKSCWAGLNISYWSEFHKFTNVRCWLCRIGCVNNGGNNVFVNCDFSGSLEIAMLMDNSTNQSPNNSHGSCIGCVFNHTSSNGSANAGIGIDILNCGAGFVFSGCQIFFSKIHLEDSPGIVFANCNFGYSNCDIEVSGGKGILFSGNIHQNTPPITISNGAEVHFANCYNLTTGALIEP